jgi:hypothetical protein
MNTFEDSIRSWVRLDNQLKTLQEQIKNLREERMRLTQNIHTYANANNLSDKTVNISDGRLRFSQTHSAQPLTFKFLEEALSEIIPNTETLHQIIKHVKNKREIKKTNDIKRYYNN